MTTNQSLRKPMKFTFRQGLKSLSAAVAVILGGAVTFLTTFFALVELFRPHITYNEFGERTGVVESKDLYHFLIFPDAEAVGVALPLIAAIGGVLMAICSFNFITSKKMVNVYYSLGITRTKLFCGKYFSGLLLIFLAISVPMLVTFIGNIISLGFSFTLVKAVLFYTLALLLTALIAFTITSAVFAAVGTTFETAIFSSIILFLPDIFFYSIQQLMNSFLYGNPYGNSFVYANTDSWNNKVESLPDALNFLSPVFWSKNELVKFALAEKEKATELIPQISPNFWNILLWFAICAAVFGLAVLLFNRRKAEICGFIGMNRYLNSAVSLLAAFASLCIIVTMLDELLLGLVIGAVVFTAVHLILEIIVLRDGKKFVRGLYKLPIGLVVSGLIVAMFYTGLFGFSQKLPEVSEIKSVAVSYAGNVAEYGIFADSYGYVASDFSYYSYSDSLTGEFTTENDIKAVLDVHKSIVGTPENDRLMENDVQFVYTLRNGKQFMRCFNSVSYESYKKLLYLEDCDFFDEQLKKYFKGEIREFKDYSNSPEYLFAETQKNLRNTYTAQIYSGNIDKVFNVNFNKNDKALLLEALYTDIINRSVDEKYYPKESPVAFIYFPNDYVTEPAEGKSTLDIQPFSAQYADFMYQSPWSTCFGTYITTDMVNTIQLFKDLGIFEQLTLQPEFISAEIVTAHDAFELIYGADTYIIPHMSRCFIGKYSSDTPTAAQDWSYYTDTLGSLANNGLITDKTKIQKLADCSFTVYQQDDTEKGHFVSFRTTDGGTYLRFIPDGKLPDGI